MVQHANGTLVLTDAGHEDAERLFAARREGMRELLAKLSRALLGEDADRHLISADPAAADPPES